jgi:NADH:ubiquinone oxidoreductase subunit E
MKKRIKSGSVMTNDELLALTEQERAEEEKYSHRIHICTGTVCVSSHSEKILETFQAEIKARGLEEKVKARQVGCMGLCAAGPFVLHSNRWIVISRNDS